MNRNVIKFIAAFSMFLDHFAVAILDVNSTIYLVFRILGRIAFVLFAYMIAEGFFKTSNLKKYFLRLLAFAVAIELFIIGYFFVSGVDYILHFNVIWPLVFGLLGLIILKQKKIWFRLLVIPLVFLAEYINTPYGAYGVLMIMIFALYQNNVTKLLFLIALNFLFIEVPLLSYLNLGHLARYESDMWWQWCSLVPMIFIFLYNGKLGKLNTKWFFYIFYPLHLVVIYLIQFIFF
ncbi:MAG: hypothetical protein JEZ05_04965 [Tenericutes bacterium]|nr:hypothetical protein [Mycoplasmatota bacterium]